MENKNNDLNNRQKEKDKKFNLLEKTNKKLEKEIERLKELNEGLYHKIGSLEKTNSNLYNTLKCEQCQNLIFKKKESKGTTSKKQKKTEHSKNNLPKRKFEDRPKNQDELQKKIGHLQNKNVDLRTSLKEMEKTNNMLKSNLQKSTMKISMIESDRDSLEATLVQGFCAHW